MKKLILILLVLIPLKGFTQHPCCEATGFGILLCIFSGFDFSTCSLPIELENFNLEQKNKNILVSWETVSEFNNDYFTILKSEDGITWEEVSIIQGVGNSNSRVYYEWLDKDCHNNIYYYRLKQTDYNGFEELFEVKVLELVFQLTVYPNPAKDYINIPKDFIIKDIQSRVLIKGKKGRINIDKLDKGVYFIIMENQTVKFNKI